MVGSAFLVLLVHHKPGHQVSAAQAECPALGGETVPRYMLGSDQSAAVWVVTAAAQLGGCRDQASSLSVAEGAEKQFK